MKLKSKYSDVILNLLVAMAISLVVNFSYMLLLLVDPTGELQRPERGRSVPRSEVGCLSVNPNGHGYLIYPNGDSLYVSRNRIWRWKLNDGDQIEADMIIRHRAGAYPELSKVKMLNGEKFDISSVYNRPPAVIELTVQLVYYLLVPFLLLSILSVACRGNCSARNFTRGCLGCLIVAVLLYCLAPVIDKKTGQIILNFTSGRMFDYLLLLKYSFAVVVSLLYGRIYGLISQRQEVVVENERLKNENLATRYNMLVGQINPHFFFNSLNSLAMLVRDKEDEKALTYIDQLSYTFRYIIQNGQSTLMSLSDELKFAEAYSYLFKIRYADKLFFDVEVDPKYLDWQLPSLSLQPLIGNAVKHNAITRNRPFHVSIYTEDDYLVVSNPKIPKLIPEPSTGIGLENLVNRWQLITGMQIDILESETEFKVKLPLQNPNVNESSNN